MRDLAAGGAARAAGVGVARPRRGRRWRGRCGRRFGARRASGRRRRSGVDVGADDDPVAVDAAEHRLPVRRGRRSTAVRRRCRPGCGLRLHRENGARGGGGRRWATGLERDLARERVGGSWSRRSETRGMRSRRSRWRARCRARPRGGRGDLGAVAEAVEGVGLAFTAAEEYETFPPPPPDSNGTRRRRMRRWRWCR